MSKDFFSFKDVAGYPKREDIMDRPVIIETMPPIDEELELYEVTEYQNTKVKSEKVGNYRFVKEYTSGFLAVKVLGSVSCNEFFTKNDFKTGRLTFRKNE